MFFFVGCVATWRRDDQDKMWYGMEHRRLTEFLRSVKGRVRKTREIPNKPNLRFLNNTVGTIHWLRWNLLFWNSGKMGEPQICEILSNLRFLSRRGEVRHSPRWNLLKESHARFKGNKGYVWLPILPKFKIWDVKISAAFAATLLCLLFLAQYFALVIKNRLHVNLVKHRLSLYLEKLCHLMVNLDCIDSLALARIVPILVTIRNKWLK